MQITLTQQERTQVQQFCKQHGLAMQDAMQLFKLGVHFGVFKVLPYSPGTHKVRLFEKSNSPLKWKNNVY